MVRFLFILALHLVKSRRPVALQDRLGGPLMEGLSQKFRTTPTPMHPVLAAASFRHRGDSAVLLHLARLGVTIPLCSESSDQARNEHRAGARERIEDRKIGVSLGQFI